MKYLSIALIFWSLQLHAKIEYHDIKVSDGSTIQVCARFPDSNIFPGPRPVLMMNMGSGLYNACRSRTASSGYSDKIVNDMGVILFLKQKRGLRHNPSNGEFETDLSKYLEVTIPNLKSDAVDALMFLKKDPRVDPNRISVWGGSEGTLLATHIALNLPNIFEVNLISSMVENFDSLFQRQLSNLLPTELIGSLDQDQSDDLTIDELEENLLDNWGLKSFSIIDTNNNGKLDRAELSAEFLRASLYSLAVNDGKFFMSELFSNGVGINWVRSAFQSQRLGPQILQLKMPVYMIHGTADINTSIMPVYDLEEKVKEQSIFNIDFRYFDGLGHELTKEIVIGSLLDSAERVSK